MLGFIGAGKMAQAMAKGLIRSGLMKPQQLMASDPDGRILAHWESMGAKTTHCNRTVVDKMDMVVLAVKPNLVRKVLRDICPGVTKDHLVMSLVAGITLDTLQQELPAASRVVRMMSNTPALVQCGATVYARGSNTLPGDGELVQRITSTFGICEEMAEKHMDSVTGLSGSGPAFMFLALEALSDGGVKMGLSRELSTRLAAQTMIGSAKMVLETGVHPGELKDSVCSPAGSTISGVFELENAGYRSALLNAVQTSSRRAYEIGLIENYDSAGEVTYASRDRLAYEASNTSQNAPRPTSPDGPARQKMNRRGRSQRQQRLDSV